MVLLVLDRGEPAEGPVQASVVVPVDSAGSDVLDVGEGLVGAVVEDGRGDRLGLEQSDGVTVQQIPARRPSLAGTVVRAPLPRRTPFITLK